MKYLCRILVLPMLLVIVLFRLLLSTITFCVQWVRYGGEIIAYNKNHKDKIADLMEILTRDRLTII
jgi:hypothetical protein